MSIQRTRTTSTQQTRQTQQTQQTQQAQTPSTTQTQTQQAPTDAVDHGAHNAARDMRYRVGVNAVTAGATQTAVPKLLQDWKIALVEAAAEDLAHDEVIAPVLKKALAQAEADKGDKLTGRERAVVSHDVERQLSKEFKAAFKEHHKDLTKSPSTKQKTERDVLLAMRPEVDQKRDPFSAVAQNLPGSRDNEIVLWENKNAMVVVDTFAKSPKALVVPKMPLSLPVDAPPGLIDELALVAAHVSDAFMRAAGTPPAGIWINPPQHLTVKQLHVHVLPDMGPFTEDGAQARDFLGDPNFRPQLEASFDVIKGEIASKLGAPST
jgi:diadenosine tetraphosphate (Ap4A) HIT family hydrolase